MTLNLHLAEKLIDALFPEADGNINKGIIDSDALLETNL
jgi:hypothetical protein